MMIIYDIPLCGECQELKKKLTEQGKTFQNKPLKDYVMLENGLKRFAERADAKKLDEQLEVMAGFHMQRKTAPIMLVGGKYRDWKKEV